MLKSNFRLENGAVTLTKDGFECADLPEVADTHVENWRKKGEVDDETHMLALKNKIEKHHLAVLRALRKVPVYQNQLWAMEQLVQQKGTEAKRREAKAVERAQRLERERLERLKREEDELNAKKAMTKPLQPLSRKRASSSDEEEVVVRQKKPKEKKPQVEEKKEAPVVRRPPQIYKPQNQQEWDRWNAFPRYRESEWYYSQQHGTEALERLVCRGVNHLIPDGILPGQPIPWIEPPALVPIFIPAAAPEVAQAAAAEAPLPDSPSGLSGMADLNLRN